LEVGRRPAIAGPQLWTRPVPLPQQYRCRRRCGPGRRRRGRIPRGKHALPPSSQALV